MRLQWTEIYEKDPEWASGTTVALDGYMRFPEPGAGSDTFLLVQEPACCAGHLPQHPGMAVEIFATGQVPDRAGPVRVEGTWETLCNDPAGWRYRIRDARVTPLTEPREAWAISRRGVLALATLSGLGALSAASLATLSACAARPRNSGDVAETLAWMHDDVTVDMHSHAGRMSLGRRAVPLPFTPVAGPMRAGGMNVVCLAIVTDSSADHIVESASGRRRIVAYREPDPGEMSSRGEASFLRVRALIAQQQLAVVTDAATLQASRGAGPGIVIAAEGADFLEGDLDRLDDAYRRHRLRHLQLTHYRVNELGDIQTAAPVHNGLTDFGAEVIRQCNRLGVVVDVAHGTFELVKRAAAVTTRPLVLSHTALSPHPGRYSRAISPDHARIVAATNGVIGIWPVATTFPDLAAMAQGIKRMADIVGVAHVGLGTDMLGLLTPSVMDSYRKLPLLAQALAGAGFTRQETAMILGGNYARVFAATMAA